MTDGPARPWRDKCGSNAPPRCPLGLLRRDSEAAPAAQLLSRTALDARDRTDEYPPARRARRTLSGGDSYAKTNLVDAVVNERGLSGGDLWSLRRGRSRDAA